MDQNKIVFYDGLCGLCHGFIQFLFKVDKKEVYMVAPLQGQTAQALLPQQLHEDLKSIIFFDQGKIFTKSDAVLAIFNQLDWYWKPLLIGKYIPKKLRDIIYDLVAKWRYKIFGKKDSCPIPSPSQRSRTLP